MRRDARAAAYKILYAEHFNDNPSEDFRKEIFAEHKLNEKDIAFAENLLGAIAENGEEINSIISSYAKGYKIERLYATDKCALSLAVAELKYFGVNSISKMKNLSLYRWLDILHYPVNNIFAFF